METNANILSARKYANIRYSNVRDKGYTYKTANNTRQSYKKKQKVLILNNVHNLLPGIENVFLSESEMFCFKIVISIFIHIKIFKFKIFETKWRRFVIKYKML